MKSSMSLLGKVLVHFVAQKLTSFGINFQLRMMHSSNLLILIFQLVEGSDIQGDWALVRTEQCSKFPSMSALGQVFCHVCELFPLWFHLTLHCITAGREVDSSIYKVWCFSAAIVHNKWESSLMLSRNQASSNCLHCTAHCNMHSPALL